MRPCLVHALLVFAPLGASAQLVTPKTVPVHQSEQFQIFPSSRPGLGGVAIAIDDTLGDPFVNPAKALRLRGTTITAAPYAHSISGNRGGGQTLPVGFLAGNGEWAGAFIGALQQLDRVGGGWNTPLSERTATNQYASGSLAKRLGAGLAVGVSAYHAGLGAVDGVDLLYAGSDRIEQDGSLSDYRLGATREWAPGHVLELMLLHNRTDMRHDVHFTTRTWDPATRTMTTTERDESNQDQTNIWGLHSEYTRPVGTNGWRVGALATANRIDHPKIPNYVLQNLPRDPGTTNSFNVGLGAARSVEGFTFAVDVVLEPISANTYADAAGPTTRTDGTVIPAGGKTVENQFRFRNSRFGLGLGRAWGHDTSSRGSLAVDFGLAMHSISYDLRQTNNITRTVRRQHENWVESGPSFGMRYRTRDVEFSYAYRATCGTDGCDFEGFGGVDRLEVAAPSTGGIIAAPSSALFFRGGRESSHHLTISLPIR